MSPRYSAQPYRVETEIEKRVHDREVRDLRISILTEQRITLGR